MWCVSQGYARKANGITQQVHHAEASCQGGGESQAQDTLVPAPAGSVARCACYTPNKLLCFFIIHSLSIRQSFDHLPRTSTCRTYVHVTDKDDDCQIGLGFLTESKSAGAFDYSTPEWRWDPDSADEKAFIACHAATFFGIFGMFCAVIQNELIFQGSLPYDASVELFKSLNLASTLASCTYIVQYYFARIVFKHVSSSSQQA